MFAEKLHQWLHTRLGDSMLTRSGNKPKFLVPAHGCIAGPKKLTSATYTDDEGNEGYELTEIILDFLTLVERA